LPAYSGEPSVSNEVDEAVDAAPAPTILFNGQSNVNGQPVANNTASPIPVVAGQKVRLDVQWPAGVAPQAQSWAGLPQNTIASFNPSASSNQAVSLPIAYRGNCQTFTESCLVFYFTSAGGAESVTYNYTLSGQPQVAATVNFTVSGPSQPNVSVKTGTVRNEVTTNFGLILAIDGVPVTGGTAGMWAQAPAPLASWPAGNYSWAQILSQFRVQYRGPQLGSQAFVQAALPVLDGVYPYNVTSKTNVPADTVTDNPYSSLAQPCAEVATVFSATMYLLWTPAAQASGCTGLNCTIPVPLGSFNWGYGCDSINTLNPSAPSNVGGWVLAGCEHPTIAASPQFQASASYPNWNGVRTLPSQSCQ
jgi:hypothetical protein